MPMSPIGCCHRWQILESCFIIVGQSILEIYVKIYLNHLFIYPNVMRLSFMYLNGLFLSPLTTLGWPVGHPIVVRPNVNLHRTEKSS